jgi:ribosomal-protein-alanine N-acetyltransferase
LEVLVVCARSYFLTTDRLGFSQWNESDSSLAVTLWGDPKVSLFIGGPFTADEIRARLRREIEMMVAYGVQYWPVFLLEENKFAGCAGLRPYGDTERVFEMGVHLLPGCWGQGFGREAARAVIRLGFERLGAKGLFAGHHPANLASRRLLEGLGFRFTHEEFYAPTGLYHPSYLLMNPADRTVQEGLKGAGL